MPNGSPPPPHDLAALGLSQGQRHALSPELDRLDPSSRAWALRFAGSCGPRAAQALRTALDVLPSLDSLRALSGLSGWQPAEALAALAALARLQAALGPRGLEAWFTMAGHMSPEERVELAERSPALLATLAKPAQARLALRLARRLAPQSKGRLRVLRLVVEASSTQPRPGVPLGLLLRLARRHPGQALSWLSGFGQGPAAFLSPAQLCRWFHKGSMRVPASQDFFAPSSPAALAMADVVGGGLSLSRLAGWLPLYASSHAGRHMRLTLRQEAEPCLPFLDLKHHTSFSLPARLGPEIARPRSVARALAFLAAASRRAGLYGLEAKELRDILEPAGRTMPLVQRLSAPALFCAAFPSPDAARRLLALAVEAWAWAVAAPSLPGVRQNLEALRLARCATVRHWQILDSTTRILTLAALALAGSERPPQALPPDFKLAAQMAAELKDQAPDCDAPGLYRLCARLYPRLRAIRSLPPPEPAAAPSSWGTPKVGEDDFTPGQGAPAPAMAMASESAGNGPVPHDWTKTPKPEDAPGKSLFTYPEWDPDKLRLEPGRALVEQRPARQADSLALQQALAQHRGLERRLKRAFLKLSPSGPAWTRRHLQGTRLDLTAAVDAMVQRAAGFSPDARIFLRRRPLNRKVSCGVLWDVSGSTRRGLGNGRQVIDAAREALALFAGALQAAGDDFALWAFSGVGAGKVEFFSLKDFSENLGPTVLRRLAGQLPLAQNRDGAAIRHATALLAQRPARRRLLIIITDGRPDDYGYGPQVSGRDLPLALGEARALGVKPVAMLLTPPDRRPHQAYRAVAHLRLKEVDSLARLLPALYHRLAS